MVEPQNYNALSPRARRQLRLEYIEDQANLCYHCKTCIDTRPVQTKTIDWRLFPQSFVDNPIHLHHSHKTGMTIGAVHAYCNAFLWQYKGE